MKTDFGVISGQREEASKEKVMCSIQPLNRQGSLDSSKKDGGATLILTLTLCNVRKTELSRAAKVFEVQTLPLTFHPLSPLTHLFCPYCLHLSYSASPPLLLLSFCLPVPPSYASVCFLPSFLSLLCFRGLESLTGLSRWRIALCREEAARHNHLEELSFYARTVHSRYQSIVCF